MTLRASAAWGRRPAVLLGASRLAAVRSRTAKPRVPGARVHPFPVARPAAPVTGDRAAVLMLQRRAGNAATARLLANRHRSMPVPLQRMCGFELEMQVPLLKMGDEGELVDPGLEKATPAWAPEGEPVRVVQDNASEVGALGWRASSIAEIVTEARDEFRSAGEFLAPMVAAHRVAAAVERLTGGLTDLVPLDKVLPGARSELLIGRPTTQTSFGPTPWPGVSTQASVQATYAVQLAQVGGWLRALGRAPRVLPDERSLIWQTREAAVIASEELKVEDPAFRGLLHLLCMYLLGGLNAASKLDKNRVALLVRHSLAPVVATGYLADETLRVLRDPAGRAKVRAAVIGASGRGASEQLFVNDKDPGGPTVGGWLSGVLGGHGDAQVGRWKEMKQIGPEPVGPPGPRGLAPVFEERQVAKELPATAWVDLAAGYQEALQVANAPPTASPATRTTPPSESAPDIAEVIRKALSDRKTLSPEAERKLPGPGEPLGPHLIDLRVRGIRIAGTTYELVSFDGEKYSLEKTAGIGRPKIDLDHATIKVSKAVVLLTE